MKASLFALVSFVALGSLQAAPARSIALLVGGTVINPRDGLIIPNAVVSIEGDHGYITAVGPRTEATRLENAQR